MIEAGARPASPTGQIRSEEVLVYHPSREAAHFRRVNSTLTGDISSTANMLTVWDPTEGHRYILRGGRLSALFTTKGTGSGVDMLMLLDTGSALSTNCLVDLGVFARDAPAGQVVCVDFEFGLLEGPWGSARDAVIRVGANATIGSGVIRVTGTLWGTEIAQ